MKYPHHKQELETLLGRSGTLHVSDFSDIYREMPAVSVYALIRDLVQRGRISPVGKGKYLAVHKPEYRPEISPWMREINEYILGSCAGVSFCLRQKGDNMEVLTGKKDMPTVLDALNNRYPYVALKQDASHFPGRLTGFILVGRMISESPVTMVDSIPVPRLEMSLVDDFCEIRKTGGSQHAFLPAQRRLEVYPVNYDCLRRYASRRGTPQLFSSLLSAVNDDRVKLITEIQHYLANTAVVRAWLFGSFARGEETDDSDIDLLVDYDRDETVSLLTTIRYKLDMERITGRDIDLIENGCLKPFAADNAARDKYLIYER